MKQAIKSALDSPSNPQELHLPRAGRRLSFFGEQMEWEELESNPLVQLGNYITANIQSERKSIMQLYSTSICLLQKTDRPLLPELTSPNAKKALKRRSGKETLQAVPSTKGSCSQEMGNDRDFIVSNNFPNKFIKKQRNRLEMIIKDQPLPTKGKKKFSPVRKESKDVPASPERQGADISKLAIRKKLPKLQKSRINEEEEPASQLNPWEYLQIQDEPIFISNM